MNENLMSIKLREWLLVKAFLRVFYACRKYDVLDLTFSLLTVCTCTSNVPVGSTIQYRSICTSIRAQEHVFLSTSRTVQRKEHKKGTVYYCMVCLSETERGPAGSERLVPVVALGLLLS